MVKQGLALTLIVAASIATAIGAETEAKLNTEVLDQFKKLSPKIINVKQSEERYLSVYEFAYAKLERAMVHLKSGKHAQASYAIDGFLHYMNQLKGLAFKDELKQLFDIERKVSSDLMTDSRSKSCMIPMDQVLTQEMIDLIFRKDAFFSKDALEFWNNLKIVASIDHWDKKYSQPRVKLAGHTGTHLNDGYFIHAEIVKTGSSPKSRANEKLRQIWMQGGIVLECRAMLILTYARYSGDAALKIPFKFMIWREADGTQDCSDVEVDFDKTFLLSRSKESIRRNDVDSTNLDVRPTAEKTRQHEH
jgi:hypothetical protein